MRPRPTISLLMLTAAIVCTGVTSSAVHADVTADNAQKVCTPDISFDETVLRLNCTGLDCARWQTSNTVGSDDEDELSRQPDRMTAEHLLLSGNRLTTLNSLEPFGAALRTVDASYNHIASIDSEVFFLSDGLVQIDLSFNKLTIDAFRNPMTLFGLSALRSLNLSRNELGNLSVSGMFSSTSATLETLDLSGNGISEIINSALTDLTVLDTLDLSNNKIRTLSNQNFLGLVQLRVIDLSDNQLVVIPNQLFGHCGSLDVVDLRRNAIREISVDAFHGLDSLTELYLGDNELPDGVPVELPSSLRKLSINGSRAMEAVNNRTFIVSADVGEPLPSLEWISISHCPSLRTVGPGSFGRFKALTVVQLADNPQLVSIDDRAFEDTDDKLFIDLYRPRTSTPAVSVLNLSGSALSVVGEKLVDWSLLKVFDMEGNAWNCDCHLEWLHRVVTDNTSLNTIVCHWPLDLRGQKFTSVVVHPPPFSSLFLGRYQTGVCLIVGLTAVFVAAIVVFAVRCRRSSPLCCTDGASVYRTLYDASNSTVTMNDADGVEASAAGPAGLDVEDDEDTADVSVISSLEAAKRPLVFRSAYHSERIAERNRISSGNI